MKTIKVKVGKLRQMIKEEAGNMPSVNDAAKLMQDNISFVESALSKELGTPVSLTVKVENIRGKDYIVSKSKELKLTGIANAIFSKFVIDGTAYISNEENAINYFPHAQYNMAKGGSNGADLRIRAFQLNLDTKKWRTIMW